MYYYLLLFSQKIRLIKPLSDLKVILAVKNQNHKWQTLITKSIESEDCFLWIIWHIVSWCIYFKVAYFILMEIKIIHSITFSSQSKEFEELSSNQNNIFLIYKREKQYIKMIVLKNDKRKKH